MQLIEVFFFEWVKFSCSSFDGVCLIYKVTYAGQQDEPSIISTTHSHWCELILRIVCLNASWRLLSPVKTHETWVSIVWLLCYYHYSAILNSDIGHHQGTSKRMKQVPTYCDVGSISISKGLFRGGGSFLLN